MAERSKILIVDDEPFNVDLLEQQLEELGYETVSAANGQEALDKVAAEAPDLILLDLLMPEPDGFQLMEALKPLVADGSFLPILALTAKAMKGDREKCLEAGASDYLAKPVNTEQLLSALRMWLHR